MTTATKNNPLDAILRALGGFIAMLALWSQTVFQPRKATQKKVEKIIIAEKSVRWPEILNAPEVAVEPTPPPAVPENPTVSPAPSKVVVPIDAHVDLEAMTEIPRPEALKQIDLAPLSDDDVVALAERHDAPVVNVRAVLRVECPTRRGFDPVTRLPIILVEYHWFSKLTHGKFDTSHPHISNPQWKGIPYPVEQSTRWKHLKEMWALDPIAAFQSVSYGLFQTMGFVFRETGCSSLLDYVRRVTRSERDQLSLFEGYLVSHKLTDALARGDWYEFARYNVGRLPKGASEKRQLSYEKSRKRYTKMLEQAHAIELEIERRNAATLSLSRERVVPQHSARCAVTRAAGAQPAPPCDCPLGGNTEGAAS
jgi:hypothetical protein